ncbi:MAG: PTS sugar transporter subunit IIA [Desulfocapsa sp.]|nr:MAG: PTS sugar transporter subunit IIA [Desulfocapsa sp.]
MVQLDEQCIILELTSIDKDDVLLELTEKIQEIYPFVSSKGIQKILTEREQLGSTGIGNGIAIPHGKVPGLEKLLLCFGRSTTGVAFEAVNNQPVHIIVLILSPPNVAEEYLQILARVSRLLKDNATRKALLQATSRKSISDIFNQAE